MCDSLVALGEDAVLFAKNSDREPGEEQVVEHHERARHAAGARLATTYLTLDQARTTHETVLSRPRWMWGAEMGANEHGLAIGNEAVFTRVPVDAIGLTGMDLVRLALERCASADEALELITWMIDRHGQGGAAGYRNKRFRYHNAFLIADPTGAWVLETAGRFWAAERVERGSIRSISNVLTLGTRYTRVGPGTIDAARSRGFLRRGETFDFRRAFGAPAMHWLSGGDLRRACTARVAGERISLASMSAALRDHAGRTPRAGLRMTMPCAHASWLPTRSAGQTTGSMISRLAPGGSTHFLTGTSAPCISVFKPVPLGRGPVETSAGEASLFWRAEALHRTVLREYEARRAAFEDERASLEARALEIASPGEATEIWREHHARVLEWRARAERVAPRRRAGAFDAYWRIQSWRDGMAGWRGHG